MPETDDSDVFASMDHVLFWTLGMLVGGFFGIVTYGMQGFLPVGVASTALLYFMKASMELVIETVFAGLADRIPDR